MARTTQSPRRTGATLVEVTPDDVNAVLRSVLGQMRLRVDPTVELESDKPGSKMYRLNFGSPLTGEVATSSTGETATMQGGQCYFSVKIPVVRRGDRLIAAPAGQAIHLNARYDFGGGIGDVQVYPRKKHTGALGRFHSKSIKRVGNWEERLSKEVKNGAELCWNDDTTHRRLKRAFAFLSGLEPIPEITNPLVWVDKQQSGSHWTPGSRARDQIATIAEWRQNKSRCNTRRSRGRDPTKKGNCNKITATMADPSTLDLVTYIDIPTDVLVNGGFEIPIPIPDEDTPERQEFAENPEAYRKKACKQNKGIWTNQQGVCVNDLKVRTIGSPIELNGLHCKVQTPQRGGMPYYACRRTSDEFYINISST